jgi:hypothetical protein
MIRSLANLSMIYHITWRNSTVSTIPTLIKPQHRSSPRPNHISTNGRPSLTKTQAKLNIRKDGKTCTILMTAWLSKTNQVWTQILSMRPMCILEREREHIGSTWSRVTCLDSPLTTAQSLLLWDLEGYRRSQRLNNSDWKQAIQIVNKIVQQTIPKY